MKTADPDKIQQEPAEDQETPNSELYKDPVTGQQAKLQKVIDNLHDHTEERVEDRTDQVVDLYEQITRLESEIEEVDSAVGKAVTMLIHVAKTADGVDPEEVRSWFERQPEFDMEEPN